jgi:protein-disulfide isomerase
VKRFRPDRRLLLSLAAAWLALAPSAGNAAASWPPEPDDMVQGAAGAKVTVVEYASAACPHCARFNNDVFPAFKKKYIDTGKVRYVYREFLTDPVPVAAAGALLARCAGKAKYFSVLDDFFHGQAHAYESGDVRGLIFSVGGKAGLSDAQITACLTDEVAAKALNDRVQRYADAEKVDSTPTFVINGRKLPDLDHEVVLADLDAAISPLLKGRPASKRRRR